MTREYRFSEAVLENVSDGIIACDQNGNITYLNPAVRKMVDLDQWPAGERTPEWATTHLSLYDPITQQLLQWDQRPLGRVLRGETVEGVEILIKPSRGGVRNVVISVRSMTDADGQITGAVAVWHDITEVRRSQEDLLTARLNAESANHAKSDFLANMSHEIRTPITAILGFSDLLQDPKITTAATTEYVQTVRRNARHLLGLINDILDLSKIEAGQMTVETSDCDLPTLVAEIMSTMRPRAAEKGLTFDVNFSGPIPRHVRTDALRLRQILMNLLGNAIKFTEHGSVETTIRFIGGDNACLVRFDVKDSGIGLTESQCERLFKPFSQADESTTRRFGGTGLGLMISRRLARILGGDIVVESTFGTGSTFSLTIDCGSPAGSEMVSGLHEAGNTPGDEPTGVCPPKLNCRILLAEDGADNQRLLTIVLQSVGASVVIAENGLIVLEKLSAEPFDLVLMDMQMPELDGYAATAEIRRRGWELPVIALTAHAMSGDRAKCLASGCTDYLSKPINPEKLMRTIARHLGQKPPEPSSALIPVATTPTDTGPIHSTLRDFPGLNSVIDQYIEGLPAEVARLQALVDGANSDSLKRLLHQIKGSGGGYGFDPITDAARNAEEAFENAAESSAVGERIDQLIAVIRRVEGFDSVRTN